MDIEEGADDVRDGTDARRQSRMPALPLSRVEPGGSPLPVSTLPHIEKIEVSDQIEGTVRGQPLEQSGQKPLTDRCLHPSQAGMSMIEEGEGVTSEVAEPVFSTCGHVGVPSLTERVTKMITDAKDGPVASGEGRAVDQLNIQDLRDIREAWAQTCWV